MGLSDLERIVVGGVYSDFSENELLDINKRLVRIEKILHRKTTQWNAPNLLRDSNSHMLIQYGTETVNHDDTWDTDHTQHTLTFPIAFDETPTCIIGSIEGSTFDHAPTKIYIVAQNTSTALIRVFSDSDPTSGVVNISWIAIGKKVL